MARAMAMLSVFFLALLVTTTPAKANDCMSVLSSIFPCKSFLRNPTPFMPEPQCCDAAKNLISLADAESLCQCFQPFASSILPSKAQMLPGLCNLDSFAPLLKCLSPSLDANTDGLLPPQPSLPVPSFPLPPFPFFPLPPFPFFPLPPLPNFPLPPLPFVPPAQSGDVSRDVILPPLPKFPLPPLPDLPLPPLPKFPLPPLPQFPLPPLPQFPLPPLPFVPPVEKNL